MRASARWQIGFVWRAASLARGTSLVPPRQRPVLVAIGCVSPIDPHFLANNAEIGFVWRCAAQGVCARNQCRGLLGQDWLCLARQGNGHFGHSSLFWVSSFEFRIPRPCTAGPHWLCLASQTLFSSPRMVKLGLFAAGRQSACRSRLSEPKGRSPWPPMTRMFSDGRFARHDPILRIKHSLSRARYSP